MIGILYFIVIIIANSVGAISGMGGGVIIKPIFDFINVDSAAAISFYSTVAVFTMSIVSTIRQMKSGFILNIKLIGWISAGSVLGGILGNQCFEFVLNYSNNEKIVKLIQIVLTVFTLLFAFLYSKYNWKNFRLTPISIYFLSGLVLGFLASLLGIGGGPINVSMLMLLFGLPIKEATVYSIGTIFFSQLSKLLTIAIGSGFERYDLNMLFYIIPAAILGGMIGVRLSHILSADRVTIVFQSVILIVLAINIYNGVLMFI